MQDNIIGQNIIITERAGALRQLGRNALRGKWKIAIIACIIYNLAITVPKGILDSLFGYNPTNIISSGGYTYAVDPELYLQLYNSLPKLSMLSTVYFLIVSGAFLLGLSLFFLASFRGHDVYPQDVFLGFERFGKAMALFLYQKLFIVLWALLFLIPGIIASIRYSQAFYILADDPDKSIQQCMNESKMMMKGNKGKYFLLMLSFIGWIILAAIPMGLLNGIVESLSMGDAGTVVLNVATSLLLAPVMTHVYSTLVGFYEILSGHLIKETAPAPVRAEHIDVEAPVETIEEVIESVEDTAREADDQEKQERE